MEANTLCLVSQSLLNRKSERMPCSDLTVFDPELRPKGARRSLAAGFFNCAYWGNTTSSRGHLTVEVQYHEVPRNLVLLDFWFA